MEPREDPGVGPRVGLGRVQGWVQGGSRVGAGVSSGVGLWVGAGVGLWVGAGVGPRGRCRGGSQG